MKLNENQVNEQLPRLAGWRREGDWLTRDFKFENFKQAMEFVNRVADEAETMDHHPDILVHGWNKVKLSVMTHSEGGLTEKDFKLAEQINIIADRGLRIADRYSTGSGSDLFDL